MIHSEPMERRDLTASDSVGGTRGRLRRIAITWAIVAAIIVVGGYFRFHALDWSDAGWPHPDERAVISQTHEMLAGDVYQPRIHSWGSLGYYSAIFGYKAYLHLQHGLNSVAAAADQPSRSTAGPVLPHFRDLGEGTLAFVGISATLLVGLAFGLFRELGRRRPRWLWTIGIIAVVGLAMILPRLRQSMLTPAVPDFKDLALIGRFVTAFASTLTLLVVYALGKRLYDRVAGLAGAAFLAVAVLPVQLAHYFTVDTLQALFIVLALWIAAGIWYSQSVTGACSSLASETGSTLGRGAGTLLASWSGSELRRIGTTLALYLLLGAAIGAAMASKFSSAPILILPVVAHVLYLYRRRTGSHLLEHVLVVVCYLATLGVWFFLEPFAWERAFVPFATAIKLPEAGQRVLHVLFSRDFAAQIHEQSRMVQGRGGGPWVQQFVDTTPWVTLTLQMVRWSFGWVLGLVCVGGFLWAGLRNIYRPRAADLLLLSWAGVAYLVVGTFKATFPRYTLAILPVICIFGARLCFGSDRESTPRKPVWRRLGWTVASLGLLSGLLYCGAFMRVLDERHAWTTASLWIFKNVPQHRSDGEPTRIANEEWDDMLPIDVPPHSVAYESVRMKPYEGDGEAKALRLADDLAQADWIALPTTRIYSTLLKQPDRYPVTANYYRSLFAGRLGFSLRKTVHVPPELWGLQIDDMAADESTYVYDHPKAVIFEKTEALSAEEIVRRILHTPAEIQGLSRLQLMRWREDPRQQLLNLSRDAYLDEGVLTRDEVEAVLADCGDLDEVESTEFLATLGAVPRHAGLRAVDVEGEIQRFETIDAASLADLGRRLTQLEARPAYPASALADLATRESIVDDAQRGEHLAECFTTFLGASRLPRVSVLANLDDVDSQAGGPSSARGMTDDPRGVHVRVAAAQETRDGQLWQAVKWLLALEVLGIAVLPWTLRIFRALPDRGYPLARILGWVLATYVAYVAVHLGLGTFSQPTCVLALVIVTGCAWLPRGGSIVRDQLPPRRLVVTYETVILVSFAAFALVRAYNPEIYWGEKTMDFSLYNATLRSGTFPPYEPWFSGVQLNYYYYGYVLVGYLTKLTGTPTAVGFNLALAVIPAATVCAAFSLAYNLSRRVVWGFVGAALVGFIGNLDPAFQLAPRVGEVLARGPWGWLRAPFVAVSSLLRDPGPQSMWDSFWASSRALGPGLINEYPLWSWLFADLHAHVIVMPVSLLLLALIYASYRAWWQRPGRAGAVVPALILMAVVFGTQLATNVWDFLAYGGLLMLALAAAVLFGRRINSCESFAVFPPFREGGQAATRPPSFRPVASLIAGLVFVALWVTFWPALTNLLPYWLGLAPERGIGLIVALGILALGYFHAGFLRNTERLVAGAWRVTRLALFPALVVLAASIVLFYGFHANLDTGNTALRLNVDGHIGAGHVMRHFGLFLLLTLLWVGATVVLDGNEGRQSGRRSWRRRIATLAAAELVTLALLFGTGWWASATGLSLYLLLLTAVAVAMSARRGDADQFFAGLLLFGGWGLAALAELVVLVDRMNTVFKLYHPAWMFLALGSAAAAATIWNELRVTRKTTVARRLAIGGITVALAGAPFVPTACANRAVYGVVTRNLKTSDKPTLDGLEFLRHSPEERELLEAIDWFNQNVTDAAVVAEAFTNRAYDESARVAKYTGLPIILGWPHHIKQRGRLPRELDEREHDLELLYRSQDEERVLSVCRRYGIRYIFVGELETQQYDDPRGRLSRMWQMREVFRSSSGRNVIYEVDVTSRSTDGSG
jgi:uncharacterized membrane protein